MNLNPTLVINYTAALKKATEQVKKWRTSFCISESEEDLKKLNYYLSVVSYIMKRNKNETQNKRW
jgi:predicted transcriptional regulator